MTDYSKTVIYKIQHNDDDSLLYVGHTSNFTKRKHQHKHDCKTTTSPLYKMMRENGGWECFTMIVLKESPCASKTEACIEEDKVMREMKSNMNKNRAYISPEEKVVYNKEYHHANRELISEKQKEYRQGNKEYIAKRMKTYQQSNREQISERQKDYREKNKEQISESMKEYRQANRELISEKAKETIECECGCIIRKGDLTRHKRSKKHLNLTI